MVIDVTNLIKIYRTRDVQATRFRGNFFNVLYGKYIGVCDEIYLAIKEKRFSVKVHNWKNNVKH